VKELKLHPNCKLSDEIVRFFMKLYVFRWNCKFFGEKPLRIRAITVNLKPVIYVLHSKWRRKLPFVHSYSSRPSRSRYNLKRNTIYVPFPGLIGVQDIFCISSSFMLQRSSLQIPMVVTSLNSNSSYRKINYSQNLENFFCKGLFSGAIAFLFLYHAGKYFQ